MKTLCGTILVTGIGVMAAGGLRAAVVEVGPCDGNATPAVVSAAARLRDGDTLQFAPGEYHFHADGAKDMFLSSPGSSTGMKKVALHLEGLKDVTVDGGGASFVFHGGTFPVVARRCDGLVIRNFTSRVSQLPIVEFSIVEKSADGFLCQFGKGHPPYETGADGSIVFNADEGRIDSREQVLSVHALRYCKIQYIATPGCKRNKDTLASTFYPVAAEDRGDGRVFFRYFKDSHPKNAGKCSYPLGEPLCILLACNRDRSLMSISDCRDVEVSDVVVRSGSGMGVVADMCENIRILRYKVLPDQGKNVSLTADTLYLVDTKGRIEIADSEISWALDDVMNIHGNYTTLAKVDGSDATVKIQNHFYGGYFPYRVGEKVEFTRGKGTAKKTLGRAVVTRFPSPERDATEARVVFDREIPPEWTGCDVANISHAPTVWIHDSYFHDYLHIRLSAFADILFEGNRLSNGQSVIMVDDLTGYWGECGPVRNLTARNNDCADMRHTFFDFHVPFTGRALLEGNRIRGRNADKPYIFGSGVKVHGEQGAGIANGQPTVRQQKSETPSNDWWTRNDRSSRSVEVVPGETASLLPEGLGFNLVWHDEFNGDSLDESKWCYRTNFWGQRAHWFATPEDNAVEVRDGKLSLKIVRRADGQIVSPQLQTGELVWDHPWIADRKIFWPLGKRSPAKFLHRYGYYECRCRLQQKPGWWSAFWMQSESQGVTLDPARSGVEHDIMESFEPGTVIPHCFHYNGYGADYKGFKTPYVAKGENPFKKTVSVDPAAYHTFGLLWEPDGYTCFIDGRQDGPRVGINGDEAVSHVSEFILLTTEAKWFRNNGMKGKGVPELEETVKTGDSFIVDYVRVFDIAQ